MPLNCLISYAYMTADVLRMVQVTQGSIRWILDSGAFTAHEQGKPIEIDQYMQFLHDYGHLFWQCIALDMVGDAAATARNLQTMRAAGLNPMPVCTVDEDVETVPAQLGDQCRHLCVAGGVSEPMELYAPRIARIRKLVGPDVWLHGLGFARGMRVAGTAVNSVDASSWMAGQRWGQLAWFQSAIGVRNIGWREALSRPWSKLPKGAQRTIVDMGLRPEHLKDPASLQRGAVSMLGVQSAFASLQYAAALEQRGIRFFFPVPSVDLTMALLVAARHATERAVPWEACRNDVEQAREIQIERLGEYARQASENAERLWRFK